MSRKAQGSSPTTCVPCMGWGTLTSTTTKQGADERGLPIQVTTTTTTTCKDCSGSGSK